MRSKLPLGEKLLFVGMVTGLLVAKDATIATGLDVVQPLTVVAVHIVTSVLRWCIARQRLSMRGIAPARAQGFKLGVRAFTAHALFFIFFFFIYFYIFACVPIITRM